MSGEKTGGSVDYYTARVRQESTVDGRDGYTVQCLEVIETLGMTFAEGEAFKAIWRSCAARTLGKLKADNDAKYNAEKVVFYGGRMLKAAQAQSVRVCGKWHEHLGELPPDDTGEPMIEVEMLNGSREIAPFAAVRDWKNWAYSEESINRIVRYRWAH